MSQKSASTGELPAEERSRGKRMMGVVMGTLSKFKSEEVDKSEANLKRLLLEKRLIQKLSQAKQLLPSPGPVTAQDQRISAVSAVSAPDQLAELESRRAHYTSQLYPTQLGQIKMEISEACAQFQQTATLPVLYFKRA